MRNQCVVSLRRNYPEETSRNIEELSYDPHDLTKLLNTATNVQILAFAIYDRYEKCSSEHLNNI